MKENEKRKEIYLHDDIIAKLQVLADLKKWSLKLYMETILTREAAKADKKEAV